MSGGHFDYNQDRIDEIREDIKVIIKDNKKKDECGFCYNFSNKTILEFRKALDILQKASIYAQRIDWLVSGDDGEESFHKRLKEELNDK